MMSRLLDGDAWNRLIAGAREHGTVRMVCLSLLLAESVCGLSVPESVAATVRGDRVAARLAREARASLFDPRPDRLDELLFHARMRERSRDQLAYLYNVIYRPSANDWSGVTLPGPLAWLYTLTRPLRLWAKFGWRALATAMTHGLPARRR
jgi:hypothetical protein